MDNRYKIGLKLMIDNVEHTLIEDNQDRGIFQITDSKFNNWMVKPTYLFRYEDLNDCLEVKNS